MRHRPARVLPTSGGHNGDAIRDCARERLRVQQLRVRQALAAAHDRARLGVELLIRKAQLRARPADELVARECRSPPEERCLLRDGMATEGAEVERDLVGVSENDVHALNRDIELVSHDLRECSADALTKVDLPRKRGDAPVVLDADPLLEPLGLTTVPHQDEDAAFWTALIARP